MPELDLRQIDALVAEHVMGLDVKFAPRGRDGGPVVYTGDRDWLEPGTPYYYDQDGQAWELPRYSSDIAAAWQVVEKMRADGWLPSLEYERGEWVCHMGHFVYDAGYAVNVSAPLAVCLAALDAAGVEVPDGA